MSTPTDAPDHRATLAELLECASLWEPGARLLGNVRAGDIVTALRWVLESMTKPAPVVEPSPKAILIARLLAVWERNPHQRLGQFLDNAISATGCAGIFYVRDVDLVGACERAESEARTT